MLVFVKADKAQSALDAIIATGEDAYMIGEMVRRDGDSVLFNGIDEAYG